MDADMQVDATINKLADQYASCDRRSAEINEERATIRENVEKLGIKAKAFVHAVGQVKQMSEGERRDYEIGRRRVLAVIGDRQSELFPEAAERARKREAERAAGVSDRKTADANADTNPRSDPKKGGAGKVVPLKGKAAAAEQKAGEAVLAKAPTNESLGGAPGGEAVAPEPPADIEWPDDLQAAEHDTTA